ncbi:MAG: DUF503 domain-containing protein [Actinomycetota bacterium]
MHVGVLRVELRIRGVRSLKEKRRVVKSIIADIGQSYPIAVAEVDHQNLWQRADIGIAVVGESPGHVDQVLDSIERDLDRRIDAEVLGTVRSYLEESQR